MVRKKVEFGKRSAINPDEAGCIKIYCEDDVKIKESSTVNANLDVRFDNLDVENSKEGNPTYLTGQFIANKVDGGEYAEWEWQPYPCGSAGGTIVPLIGNSEHIALTANGAAGEVDLTWLTNTEDKNDRFVIERSGDGLHFLPLFEVPSERGEQVGVYKNKDKTPMEGANFYRVRVIFENGNSKLSEVRLANIGIDNDALTLFPNPAQHHVSMYWEQYAGRAGTVLICNSLGLPIVQQEFDF
ncbi:MAG: hypothetical protein R2830_08730 [Saprospiraceae bacterium]